jgi:hypothetical protein
LFSANTDRQQAIELALRRHRDLRSTCASVSARMSSPRCSAGRGWFGRHPGILERAARHGAADLPRRSSRARGAGVGALRIVSTAKAFPTRGLPDAGKRYNKTVHALRHPAIGQVCAGCARRGRHRSWVVKEVRRIDELGD